MEALRIEKVSFAYPEVREKALDGVTFKLEKGDFCLLIGESGSGKTTLLKLLKKEIAPVGEKSGEFFFTGKPLEQVGFEKIGYVAQSPDSQIVTDKVWHELAFGLENMGLEKEEIRLRVGETASYFGIGNWYRKNTDELSGGQKQLLNLAAVIAMRPEVLLLDEPTAQLDPIAAEGFLSLVARLNRELGITILISEHCLEEALPLANRVVALEKGRLIACGTPKNVCEALKGHSLFAGFPGAARIWNGLSATSDCPLTVKEGRDFLHAYYPNATGRVQKTAPAEGEAAVELEKLYFRYERTAPDVLKELNLRVSKGEIFSLLGANGSGKSTLLRVIAATQKPYRGKRRILGKELEHFSAGALYRETLAFLPQDPTALFIKNTVEEDFSETLALMGIPRKEARMRIEKWITRFEIESLLAKHPYDLSGGERQKCALVKLLLTHPKILLLDEPTKGLDAAFKNSLAKIMPAFKGEGVTVITATHDVEFAATVSDRCGLLFDGAILSTGTPNAFFSGNHFYTTAASRISRGRFENAVLCEEVITLCRGQS